MDSFPQHPPIRYLVLVLILLLSLPAAAQRNNIDCGELQNAYGPWDYTNPEHYQHKLPIVTANHFTPEVANLIRGQSAPIEKDLDYTLRAFPNHYRALNAMARLQRRNPELVDSSDIYSAPCYFKRALQFKDDPTLRMLYAMHLQLMGQLTDARTQYETALKMGSESVELRYNYGLLLTELKEYPLAQEQAQKAYAGGYPLPGLKEKLRAVNHWPGD